MAQVFLRLAQTVWKACLYPYNVDLDHLLLFSSIVR